MKTRAILVFVVALFVASITTSAVRMLKDLTEFTAPHLTESNIVTGKVHHFYLAHETWQRFPTLPWPISVFIDLRALGIMAVAILVVIYVGRLTLRMPYSAVGLFALSTAALPYAFGAITLANNAVPENAGPRLAIMLLSVLYGSAACAILALMDFVPPSRMLNFRSKSDSRPRSPIHVQRT